MVKSANPRDGYLRSRGWKDLIFLVVVLALGTLLKLRISSRDFVKWKARPALGPVAQSLSRPGGKGSTPCLIIVTPGTTPPPMVSSAIGDCLLLVPDGSPRNLFEVNLWTGAFIPVRTDLTISDIIPLAFTRTYCPLTRWSRRFHVYAPHVYDPYVWGDRNPYTHLEWDLPDRNQIFYRRISAGTGYGDAVYESDRPNAVFGGSRIAWNGNGWDLVLLEGTTYLSPEAYNATRPSQGSLEGIFDRDGHEVRLSRQTNGDLTEITSPSGGWIRLDYAEEGKFIRARDSSGSKVGYGYDSHDRLTSVSYSNGRVEQYSFDSADRIIEIEAPPGIAKLTIGYDPAGRVVRETLPDQVSYLLSYGPSLRQGPSYVDIKDPQGKVTRVSAHSTPDGKESWYEVEPRD